MLEPLSYSAWARKRKNIYFVHVKESLEQKTFQRLSQKQKKDENKFLKDFLVPKVFFGGKSFRCKMQILQAVFVANLEPIVPEDPSSATSP